MFSKLAISHVDTPAPQGSGREAKTDLATKKLGSARSNASVTNREGSGGNRILGSARCLGQFHSTREPGHFPQPVSKADGSGREADNW